jgi:hypothetical protein
MGSALPAKATTDLLVHDISVVRNKSPPLLMGDSFFIVTDFRFPNPENCTPPRAIQ